jgi:hypothetical protein
VLLILVIVAATFLLVQKLSSLNNRHQVVKRLSLDTAMNARVTQLKELVQSHISTGAMPGTDKPQALYVGRVKTFEEGAALHNQPPTRTLYLERAVRLEGTACRHDRGGDVTISYKTAPRDLPPANTPKAAQWWILLVSRDASGNNVLHSAYEWVDAMRD